MQSAVPALQISLSSSVRVVASGCYQPAWRRRTGASFVLFFFHRLREALELFLKDLAPTHPLQFGKHEPQ